MPQPAEDHRWAPPPRLPLITELASTPSAVRASQRLRYQVFAEEMGAHLPSADQGIDVDAFDAFCEHLLVRESATDEVVASTRILTAAGAAAVGGFYSQGEFDLAGLERLPGRVMEVGRTCVRADYRTGWAINALWTGLARLMAEQHFDYMMGCASIPFRPGDAAARALLDLLYVAHPAPEPYQVHPRRPVLPLPVSAAAVPPSAAPPVARGGLPPLLKAYLRLGAWICGEACWDPDFGVADVFILLDVKRVPHRYRRHFLGEPADVS